MKVPDYNVRFALGFQWRRLFHVVKQHLTRSHSERNRYVCSGTKQLRVFVALFQNDQFIGRRHHGYLHRSAELLRESVSPFLLRTDKKCRLLLAGSVPTYVAVRVREGSVPLRCVGNKLNFQSIGEKLQRNLLLHGTRMVKTVNNLPCEL